MHLANHTKMVRDLRLQEASLSSMSLAGSVLVLLLLLLVVVLG